MEIKICCKCKLEKNISEFGVLNRNKDGLNNLCKICYKEKLKIYRENNIVRLTGNRKKRYYDNQNKSQEYSKEYYNKNKEHSNKVSSEWNKKNKDKRKNINNKHRQLPNVKLRVNLRHRVYMFLKTKSIIKNKKTMEIIGCDFVFIKNYLESKFIDGMSWENYGKWHVDHLIPLSSANSEEEIYKLCHYTNLQPLWSEENLKKGKKIIWI